MGMMNRRQFLKWGGLVGVAAITTSCLPKKTINGGSKSVSSGKKKLKIVQQTHFVPAYDAWFDKEFIPKWSQANNVEVTVEHLAFADLYPRAAQHVADQSGSDLFAFANLPAMFEGQTTDLTDVVTELEKKFGKMEELARRSTYNPKTKKYFGISDHWVPFPILYRKDLWDQAEPGSKPDTWEDMLRVGRKLKAMGYPLGIGMSPELDSNTTLRSLMYSYGSSIQDEQGNVVINSKNTIEALKMGSALFTEAMTPEIFSWSSSSNNQYLLSKNCSAIQNAISALRTAEKRTDDLGQLIYLSKICAGPTRRLGPANLVNVYTLWKFSPVIDLAKKFLVDLITDYATAFSKSELYNLPSFPGTVPQFKSLLDSDPASNPRGKYNVLADANSWTTNLGYPGYGNAAIHEVLDTFIIPKMFALTAQGQMSPEEAARWAESSIKPIFQKWKSRGLI